MAQCNRQGDFMAEVAEETDSILKWPLKELIETAQKYAKKGYIKKPFSATCESIVAQYERTKSITDKQKEMLARSVAFVTVGEDV